MCLWRSQGHRGVMGHHWQVLWCKRSPACVSQVSSGWAVKQELTSGLCVSTWVCCSGLGVRCRNWEESGPESWGRRSALFPIHLRGQSLRLLRFKVLSSVLLLGAGLIIRLWNRNLQQRHSLHHLYIWSLTAADIIMTSLCNRGRHYIITCTMFSFWFYFRTTWSRCTTFWMLSGSLITTKTNHIWGELYSRWRSCWCLTNGWWWRTVLWVVFVLKDKVETLLLFLVCLFITFVFYWVQIFWMKFTWRTMTVSPGECHLLRSEDHAARCPQIWRRHRGEPGHSRHNNQGGGHLYRWDSVCARAQVRVEATWWAE